MENLVEEAKEIKLRDVIGDSEYEYDNNDVSSIE